MIIGSTQKYFNEVLKFYLRRFPLHQGKKMVLNYFYPMLLGENYREEISFKDGRLKGYRMKLDLDDWIQRQLYYFGEYFVLRDQTECFYIILKEGDVVLDIGANVGFYTLLASRKVGNSGQVHAFDPVLTKDYSTPKTLPE